MTDVIDNFSENLQRAVQQLEGRGIPVVEIERNTRSFVAQLAGSMDRQDGVENGRIQKSTLLGALDSLSQSAEFQGLPNIQAIRGLIESYPADSIQTAQFRTVLNTAIESRLNRIHGGDWHVNAQEMGQMSSPEQVVALLQEGLDRLNR